MENWYNIAKTTMETLEINVDYEDKKIYINFPVYRNDCFNIYVMGCQDVYVGRKTKDKFLVFANKADTENTPDNVNNNSDFVDTDQKNYVLANTSPIPKIDIVSNSENNYKICYNKDGEDDEYIETNIGDEDESNYTCGWLNLSINKHKHVCIYISLSQPFDIYLDKQRSHIKSHMSTRDFREATHERKNNMYKAKDFDQLWLTSYLLKPKYIKAITGCSFQCYTLYDMICYIYIRNHFIEAYFLEQKNTSLRKLTCTISMSKENDKYCNTNETDIPDKSMNHFKGFLKQTTDQFKKFFNFIFESKSGFNDLKKTLDNNFNVLDYGFLSYLASAKAAYDLNDFIKKKWENVSSEFYAKAYIGLKLMATTHDISLTEEDIDQMFQTRFNQPHEKTIADIQAIYNKI